MNAYVLGAGVSRSVGYPLGSELFDEIDKFVRESGDCHDRFDYRDDWEHLHCWLKTNTNPTIVQAYATKNVEHLFTVLDFAAQMRTDALLGTVSTGHGTEERTKRAATFAAFDKQIEDYQRYRGILLWALEHYFAWRHSEDYGWEKKLEWDALNRLADKLKTPDVVITFNYDATLERVLLSQGKWSPSDGYGFELLFQQSRYDKTLVSTSKSQIRILHLHGATGWYRRPTFAPGYQPAGSGAVPAEVFGAAPMSTHISLDPKFLEGLGLFNVDACLPDTLPVADERHVVLHPSFLKDYETDEQDSHVFVKLWQEAAKVLREAAHTYIIGYSLPRADVAALTLMLTNIRRGSATVVNPSRNVVMRLGRLFSGSPFSQALTLDEWVAAGCPAQIQGSRPWVTAPGQ